MNAVVVSAIRIAHCLPVLLVILFVAGCASTPPAPVEDRSLGSPRPRAQAPKRPSTPAIGGVHRVQRGDTLYSIAFRNGLDYRELARLNGIVPPYTIHVGQEIRLGRTEPTRPAVATARPAPASPAPSPPASRPRTPPASSTSAGFEDVPATAPVAAAAPAPKPAQPAPAAPPVAAVPRSAPAPVETPSTTSTSAGGNVAGWRWPADGQRIGGYVAGDPTRQGIDIAGKPGDPVRAAADGEVVYSGNGLIGYGELVIVKHSPALLSAYGHNRRRLVQEGDKVKAGQQIAEMGSSSASRDMLHFEIRRNGKPVDPAAFLPPR